jgi:tRNA(Ile)-lysidine synthase
VHDFLRKLITEWRRLELPVSEATIVIGVSGGADSVSLLLAVDELRQNQKLDLRLVAAHFNHQLRDGESDADEEFVRDLTTQRKIELAVGYPKEPLAVGNVEQNARNARYRFLRQVAESVDAYAILTGHTVNDQAETFLINLIRGSGPQGLCGMRAVRPLDAEGDLPTAEDRGVPAEDRSECSIEEKGETEDLADPASPLLPFASSSLLLVRPLLRWARRKDTEGFCHSMNVEYRYDTMNEDTAFKRVRIRKILLPLLADFNPNIIDTLANTAALMQKVPSERNHAGEHDELSISELRAVDDPQLSAIVRTWLGQRRGTTRRLGTRHFEAIERLIKSEKSGRVVEVPGGQVIKSGGKLTYQEN